MSIYKELQSKHSADLTQLKKKSKQHSSLRFLIAILFILLLYFHESFSALLFYPVALILVAVFVYIVRSHQKITLGIKMTKNLQSINKDEIDFLNGKDVEFNDGNQFIDTSHPFSYDLDFFGPHSLFQYLNRTTTYKGQEQLSKDIVSFRDQAVILEHQDAIKELAPLVEWRQIIQATAKIKEDSKEAYDNLIDWCNRPIRKVPMIVSILSFITPFLTIGAFVTYVALDADIWFNIGFLMALVNLVILGSQIAHIKEEISPTSEIDKILKQYGLIIRKIEQQDFDSKLLSDLKSRLIHDSHKASDEILHLSSLFLRMDHVQNIFASPLLNGLLLYHIHTLRSLSSWKSSYRDDIKGWLEVIGKLEALNSLANFYYNNPGYSFPSLNTEKKIEFKDLGHPLISAKNRVVNDVSFNENRYFVLTGSNMSGKSTFLRTLGVNMVLAGTGAPICATSANLNPMEVLVSMRLSDSLTDSQSYFLAEVQRLKEIMEMQESSDHFILLDEILRGTNSDDKRSGTIEVVRKMVKNGAIGAIATHDLEVCKTTEESPDILANKRFEVEIVDDELVFDYKLKDGICQNKSATFLMKKMGVI